MSHEEAMASSELRQPRLSASKENESTESNVGPPCAEVTTKKRRDSAPRSLTIYNKTICVGTH